MRINIYHQEYTDRVELVSTVADTGSKFVGVRMYLQSPDCLKPPMHQDDDSSAITFWVPSNNKGYKTGDEQVLAKLFRKMSDFLEGIR